MAGALREPFKMRLAASIFPMERIIQEWFAAKFRTDENMMRLQRVHPNPHDLPQAYVLFEVYSRHDDSKGRRTEARVGSLRLYGGEVILHIDKKYIHLFDSTEEIFRKLQT